MILFMTISSSIGDVSVAEFVVLICAVLISASKIM